MSTITIPVDVTNALAQVPAGCTWSGGTDPAGVAAQGVGAPAFEYVGAAFALVAPSTGDLPDGSTVTAIRLTAHIVGASVPGAAATALLFGAREDGTGLLTVGGPYAVSVGPADTDLAPIFAAFSPGLSRARFLAWFCATPYFDDPPGSFTPGPLSHRLQWNGVPTSSSATWSALSADIDFDPPTVTPDDGGTLGGDPVTIHAGSNFAVGTTVTFDGVAATDIAIVDANTLTCVTPAHAVGLVDILITNPDASTVTLPFTYSLAVSAPIVEGGPAQVVTGPPPATVTTAVTVTRGRNNGTLTYAWALVDGPGSPTITTPDAVNTDIEFPAYEPGTYVFELTVTTEGPVSLVASGRATFVIAATVAPRVRNGSAAIVFADDPTTTLTPAITDDAWGGALAYAWTPVSGPDTATIDDAAAASTLITVPDASGTYVFELAVSRADDALVGVGRWRVSVYGSDAVLVPNVGDAIITANGVAVPALLNQCRISKSLGAYGTASFVMFDAHAEVCNEIIIERDGVRLFGGVCLSTDLTFVGTAARDNPPQFPFWTHRCVGYGWHLGREPITKAYDHWSISDIVADLLTLSPGAVTGEFIAPGLPVTSVAFTDVTPATAIAQLEALIPQCHSFVDDFKRMHFGAVEPEGDPLPLSLSHPWFKDLTLSRTVAGTVNRVRVNYRQLSSVTTPVAVAAEVEVDSLDGYSVGGGDTVVDGTEIHYTGIATRVTTHFHSVAITFEITEVENADGEIGDTDAYSYRATLTTTDGETSPIWGASGGSMTAPNNAWKIRLTFIGSIYPLELAAVTGVNIYKVGASNKYVGTISPKGGSIIDGLLYDSIEAFAADFDYTPNAGEHVGHFLTGCTGQTRVTSEAISTVQADDEDAQADLAARLGGTDTGVIAITLNGGDITREAALEIAEAYLADNADLAVAVGVTVGDDHARPGQTLAFNFPAPIDVADDLTIQQADLSGFQDNVPNQYVVRAARQRITLNDLLQRR